MRHSSGGERDGRARPGLRDHPQPRRELRQARQGHLQDKADAARNLYFALAAFGLFLLIVFLSIFIRIERNLRHLEQGARAPRDGLLT